MPSPVPDSYCCHECGVTGCKLWREIGDSTDPQLLCVMCTLERYDMIGDDHSRTFSGANRQIEDHVPAVPSNWAEPKGVHLIHVAMSPQKLDQWLALPTHPPDVARSPL